MSLLLLLLGSGQAVPPTDAPAATSFSHGITPPLPRLHAARYNDVDYSGSSPAETFADVRDIGIRWALPGGVRRIELTVRASSEFDAWQRYQDHLGHRIAIYDHFVDRYIGGQVYEVSPSEDWREITYICAGPWKRANDDVYNLSMMSDIASTDDTDVVIKDILDDSDFSAIVNTDQSNIDSTSLNIGGWVGWKNNAGIWAGDAIAELANLGDSSNNPLDFYLVDAPFNGVQLQKPLPYLKARSTTASPDWIFEREDMAAGGLRLSRNIWNLIRGQQVRFGRIAGTATSSTQNLNDTGATFLDGKVKLGDEIINITQGKSYLVGGYSTQTELVVSQGDSNNFATNDLYSIRATGLARTTRTSSSETDFWVREFKDSRLEMDETQADAFGAKHMAIYEKPVQQQAFTISAPTIRDGNGTRWPLWRVLMGDSFYFRITDLYPEAAVLSSSDDRSQTFIATAMDYTYRDNRLRIVPGTEDTRLDVLIQQALAEKRDISQIISTATGR